MSENELMVLEKKEGARVVACPHPFKVERMNFVAIQGNSVQQILESVQPDPVLRTYACILINDSVIPQSEWGNVYPFEKDIVTIRTLPAGGGGDDGGGKNVLKTVLMIVVIVAAAAVGAGALGANFMGGMFAAGEIGAAIAGALVGAVGMLAVNALIPPKAPTAPGMPTLSGAGGGLRESPSLFMEGARNTTRYFGAIPFVLGTHKHVPPLGSQTYTEIVGNDHYLRMMMVWGYGRLKIEDVKIGNTSIQNFDGIDIETVEGVAGDPDLTLFPDTVSQENFSVLLKQADGWTTKTSAEGVNEISVDVVYGRGLVTFDDSGNRNNRTNVFEMQYRETDTAGDWLRPNLSASGATINNAVVKIDTESTQTRTVVTKVSRNRKTGYSRNVYSTESYTQTLSVHDPVTDTGSEQVITSGIKSFSSPGIITATVEGAGSVVDAVQIVIVGTDTSDGAQNETLPAFTDDTPGTVKGSLVFKTVTSITYPAQSGGILSMTVTNNKASAVRYGFRWKTPSPAQYDVRVQRTTADTTSTRIYDEVTWACIRSFVNEDPDTSGLDLAKTALVVKATEQLSGVIDDFSATVSSYVLDWNGASWVEGTSSNPASLFRHVLQSAGMSSPLENARIDLTTLQTWHTYCANNEFEFNQIRDYKSSVWEVLSDICIAGRATPTQIDGKWSVVIDKTQTIPTQHFTNKNSWGFEAEKNFPDIPHALRVRFANRESGWQQDERIVYDTGYDSSNATKFEEIDAIGVTHTDHVWKFARFNLVQMRLRPEKWYLQTDFEYLVSRRGDLVLVTHDVLLVGLKSGRIKELQTASNGDVTGVTVDEDLIMEAEKTYGMSIRTRDDAEIVRTIVDDVGTQTTIVFTSEIAAADAPVAGDLFGFGESGSETIEALILSIESQGKLTARLTLIPYSSDIYTADTGSIPAYDPKITPQGYLPEVEVVGEPRTDESVIRLGSGNTLIPRIAISFEPLDGSVGGTVKSFIRVTGSDLPFAPCTNVQISESEIMIEDIEQGETYDVKLHWTSPNKLPGAFSSVNNITVVGLSTPPSPLANLMIVAFGNLALVQWDALTDIDVRFGGSVKFRHSHETDSSNASWSGSVTIGSTAKGSDTMAQLPLKAGTYLARVFDKGGRASTVVKMSTKQASVISYAAASNITQESTFSGTHTDTVVSDGNLKLAALGLFDDITDVDEVSNIDYSGGVESTGTYDFSVGHDLGSIKKTRITTDINAIVTSVLDRIDGRSENIDVWESIDGDVTGEADCRIQVRVTDGNPLGEVDSITDVDTVTDWDDTSEYADWSEWNNIESAEFYNRAFDYRAILTTDDSAFNIIVTKLQVNSEEPS